MAFKITKGENDRIAALLSKLDTSRILINAKLDEYRGEMEGLVEGYNEIREELRGVLEDIHNAKQDEYDDKSDNWREGERGEATYEWLSKLEEAMNTVSDDLTVEIPEDIEFDDEVQTLMDEGLPSEPEY